MSEAVKIAFISGLFSLVCGIISAFIAAKSAGNEVQKKLEIAQAVTDTKIDNLTTQLNKHNNFGERIPVIETKVENLEHRVNELEDK